MKRAAEKLLESIAHSAGSPLGRSWPRELGRGFGVVVIAFEDSHPAPAGGGSQRAPRFTSCADGDREHVICAVEHWLYHMKGEPHAH